MTLISNSPLARYIIPEAALLEFSAECELLIISGNQNEDVDGQYEPDLTW